MMYLHYCKRCQRVHILNGHKQICPRCQHVVKELKLSYLDYVAMDESQRTSLHDSCSDDEQLKKLSVTYRMYKYSKWYKELQLASRPMIYSYAPRPGLELVPLENAASLF